MEPTLLSPKYKKALHLVAELFKDKTRKITGVPFIVHLEGVCHIVTQVTDDENVWIAALLHDVLEDIPSEIYDESRMRADFGEEITEIVKTVSLDIPKYGRDANKEYLKQISNGPIEASVVSAADLLYNTSDFVSANITHPEQLKVIFGNKKAVHREWFFGERFKILKNRLGEDNRIIKELEPLLVQLSAIHKEIQ